MHTHTRRSLLAAALCLLSSLTMGRSIQPTPPTPTPPTPPANCGVQTAGVYGLTSENVLFLISNGEMRARHVSGITGNLIGIDFRPSDGANHQLYGLTDSGQLYKFPLDPFGTQPPMLVSTLSTSFTSVAADFNPIVPLAANGLRILASDGRNAQVVDGAGSLDTIFDGSPIPSDDGVLHLTGAAYSNNLPIATYTRLYFIEHVQDLILYESGDPLYGGLHSLGRIPDIDSTLVDFAPNAGMDIVTHPGIDGPVNTAFIASGPRIYCVSNVGVFDQRTPEVYDERPIAIDITLPFNPLVTGNGSYIDVAVIPVE